MRLSRVNVNGSPRLVLDGELLPKNISFAELLRLEHKEMWARLEDLPKESLAEEKGSGALLCPAEAHHEVWASGVTYLRSRDARKLESQVADVYEKVYDAERPELFFKALGWRSVGHGAEVRIRADSPWNVPEAEVCLVVNRHLDIVGYCAGNDVSSRAIEGENPLYLPQAKMYNGACALGPGVKLLAPDARAELDDLAVTVVIERAGAEVFSGGTSSAQMKRTFEELVAYLGLELTFPDGVFLLTGTGVVPPENFTLQAGDVVTIGVGGLELRNAVAPS